MALIIGLWLVNLTKVSGFVNTVENKSFDMRQKMSANSGYKKPNKDIVILAIDDASYEYLLENYGEWPIPRGVYAQVVNYINKQNPKAIAFDLMFVKSMKSKQNDDLFLSQTIGKNQNVYTAINFDDQSVNLRTPIVLPEKLSVEVENNSSIDYSKELSFNNCRAILQSIIDATPNIGVINVSRAEDGILRKMPPFVKYQNKFYPNLSMIIGLDYLGISKDKFVINQNNTINLDKTSINLSQDGGAILNWYGPAGKTFTYVPFYKVVKAMKGQSNEKFDFSNKIIYVGTTAVSLFDTKSVPVDKIYPGVEMHATFVNNLIDNNFIKKIDGDFIVALLLSGLVGIAVIYFNSALIGALTLITTTAVYIMINYALMKYLNIWLGLITPLIAIFAVFAIAYIIKYLLKSKDFDHQYKLATIDGLTELYNHRFFQEQMSMNIENAKRYETHFSLILIDIDHFKKFNDDFGHQAGDTVLKQVAQTLRKKVRSTDLVCRYGGEEMSIILPNTDEKEARVTAEKIRQAVETMQLGLNINTKVNVTISSGVATFPQDGESTTELIASSDAKLYKAKENGRNQVG